MTETRSVVVEREFPHPPEKLWRALTQPHLIEEWLMKNDFAPVVGHRFNLRGDWGGVLDCEVLFVDPNRTLTYSWDFAHDDAAYNLRSVVTMTLTPTSTGTHLRMEQAGFRPDQPQALGGARVGWKGFMANLEQVLARIGLNAKGGSNELEQVDSAVPPLDVHGLYGWLYRQRLRFGWRRRAGLLGVPPGPDPALPALPHRSLHVRAALCRQVA